jgi:dynactin complex subunit
MNNETIENNFMYHSPKEGQPEIYQNIRSKAKELAKLIQDVVPDGREKSLAFTKLEESVFWSNAGIARS